MRLGVTWRWFTVLGVVDIVCGLLAYAALLTLTGDPFRWWGALAMVAGVYATDAVLALLIR